MLLCVGETQVELVCPRPQGDAFVPRVGGWVARVAVGASRVGARVALAGSAGEDEWGRWLRARLAAAGVDVSLLELRAGAQTPLEVVSFSGRARYGQAPDVRGALSLAGVTGLCISLSGPEEREAVQGARAVALEHGLPVMFAPGLRLERWRSQADAAASLNACVPGALLLCVSASEASVMTGEEDPERAALALIKAGARLVVVMLGDSRAGSGAGSGARSGAGSGAGSGAISGAGSGAILRGELRAEAAAPAASEDAFFGGLFGRLALSDYYPPVVAAALR